MAYSHKNSKGQTYWLHIRETAKGAKLFFFSKDEKDSSDLPDIYQVIEGPTGLPMVKKKQA
jgi:hypothetical protein